MRRAEHWLALALVTWRLCGAGGRATWRARTQTVVLGLPQAPLTYTLCLFAGIASLVMAGLLLRTLRGELPAAGGPS